MVLTKTKQNEFFENQIEVRIKLEGDFDKFTDYRDVFDFFSRFDRTYYEYKSSRGEIEITRGIRQQNTKVISVSG